MRRFVLLIPFVMLGLSATSVSSSHAQSLCSSVMPSSAALHSDGTLGIGFQFNTLFGAKFRQIRPLSPGSSCFTDSAVDFMKQACVSFLEKQGGGSPSQSQITPPATLSACSAENGALNILVKENMRLKGLLRTARVRASRG